MSRVGRKPIMIPANVKVAVTGGEIHVEGPKGKLTSKIHPRIKALVKDNAIVVERGSDHRTDRSLHGLTRSLLQNMVHGVTDGFKKELEIEGVGYRAQVTGKKLVMSLGFSHPVEYAIPEGIEIKAVKPTQLVISGADRAKVGQAAAEIRGFREPEPYKGKGIHYVGEIIRRKQGKTVA